VAFTLDPQLAAVLAARPARPPTAPVGDVATRRARTQANLAAADAAHALPADVTITDHYTDSVDGAPILLRHYARDGAMPGSAVLYFHGGGLIAGNVDLFDSTVAGYVSDSGVPMVAVDYRLAPENPYPTPVEDCYAGLEWLSAHAAEVGVDPARIAVMGESSGGGLAAALALLARDRNGPRMCEQILIYPMLDDHTTVPDPEIEPFAVWTYADNATGWRALLGEQAGGPDVSAYAAPARVADATGLPGAYIEVGQLDIYRDEDLAYARLLSRAGVEVEFHLRPGVPHEFDTIAPNSDVARRARADRLRVLTSL
jgi:acetyl esterase/lipase